MYSGASELACAVQIIDAQKARLKRELKALEGRAQEAAAGKAQAETLPHHMHDADVADASAEQHTIAARHEQHTECLQHQSDDTDLQPEEAAEHARRSAERQENEVRVSGFSMSAFPADCAHQQASPAHCRGPVQIRHVGCHAIVLSY